ncbi:MAG: cyclic nucleotide-binding domain-containing protein [Treponema sp.]|jgi:diguanylate cyclase (GGDEF)-like protein|nr:cyclic nucleotide-binding domain-containing protein [Treponema sp.]
MVPVNFDHILITKTELFNNLDTEEINFVISHSGMLNLSKRTLLFSAGEKANHLYILTEGAIRVYKNRSDGGEDEIAIFTAGDTIGDFDFARGADYDACAEADEDSKLVKFPCDGHTIDSLAKEEPRVVCHILLNAILLMTGRIKSTHKLILENMPWVQELHRRVYEDFSTGLFKQSMINDEIISILSATAALIMLKPDRFKILVDSRGHSAGDEAMIRIAAILKNIIRRLGYGWALRFKSNETGLIINNCGYSLAEKIAKELYDAIAAMEPVPSQGDIPEFNFSTTISWAICDKDKDGKNWDDLFNGVYSALLNAWRAGGERIVHYSNTDTQ